MPSIHARYVRLAVDVSAESEVERASGPATGGDG
jgi:hypothetical protein